FEQLPGSRVEKLRRTGGVAIATRLNLVRCDERSAVGACEITADSITCADRCDTARFELEKRR
ncbi:MAG: hypothetical protein AAFX94_13035, partial [Myxococcota bacterium]